MKILLYIVIGVFLIAIIIFVILSISSRKQPELGLVNGQLRACPATPNCVCSEQLGNTAFIEPLIYSSTTEDAWRRVKQAIVDTGGIILTEQGGYLHARYDTSLMRYIDDVELWMDESKLVIHIRSASRVGHSDMGVNRKRVSRIRTAFNSPQS